MHAHPVQGFVLHPELTPCLAPRPQRGTRSPGGLPGAGWQLWWHGSAECCPGTAAEPGASEGACVWESNDHPPRPRRKELGEALVAPILTAFFKTLMLQVLSTQDL